MADFLQFLFSGLTSGSIYALSALGFTIIWNARGLINFSQGDFVMLGGMITAALLPFGITLPFAIFIAAFTTVVVGILLQVLALAPAKKADPISLVIITIGSSVFIQGATAILIGKNQLMMPPFSGETPIRFLGAALSPQSLWTLAVSALVMTTLTIFFRVTLTGRAMKAVAINPSAARLVGIHRSRMLIAAFALAALVGAVAGIVSTPISSTRFDVGLTLGLKGFVGATLGGLGSGIGAVVGGLLVGIAEAMMAGYVSSAYKDAVPFALIILTLLLMPSGLFGNKQAERV